MTAENTATENPTPATTTPATTTPATTTPATTTPATMLAVVATGYGIADVLEVSDAPVPKPKAKQVLVRVEGSSLNALDWHFLTGTPYLLRLINGFRNPRRKIPGADVAGTVIAVGNKVSQFEPGDAVFGECSGGGCAPFLAVSAAHVTTKPAGVSFEDAGATPVAGLTALQGLRTHAAVQPGDQVLINGAAGGVGTFAVQIAKALGGQVTAVCSTRNIEMVRSLGADTVIDYTVDDFVVGGARFDVMLDNVGNRSPAECLSVLRPGARYVAVSGPKTNQWLGPIPHQIRTALAFRRAAPSFHSFTAAPKEADLITLGEMLADGSVKPAIDRVVGLDQVAAALTEIGSGHARSKIAVRPS